MVPAIMKSRRHEIALHGWIHESLPTLNDAAEEQRLLTQSIDYFTKVTSRRPVGYRAGAWALSHHSVEILRKANLFLEAYNATNSGTLTGGTGNMSSASFLIRTSARDARQIQWGARYLF
jgi:peptidoglycan/xylan/chitin deacetylase (PgdA/CDA1 family)